MKYFPLFYRVKDYTFGGFFMRHAAMRESFGFLFDGKKDMCDLFWEDCK